MTPIKRIRFCLLLVAIMEIFLMPASSMAHGIDFSQYSDDDRPDKAGVLVIALVPTDATTAAKQDLMDQRIKAAYSGMAVRWAYLNLGSGQAETFMKTGERESPKQVLDQMEEEGITHVAILPLAVIPSETYARLVWMVDTMRQMPVRFRRIALARPFFGAPEDIRQTCLTVLDHLPDHAGKDEAVVLFFEERSRLGDYIYPGLQYYFWQLDKSVFIATAGTTPGQKDVAQALDDSGVTKISLVPFLPYQTPALAAWGTALEKSGFRVRTIEESIIGREKAMDVMVLRLQTAMKELDLGMK